MILVEYVVIKRWEQWPQPQKKILPAFLGNVWLCNLHNNGENTKQYLSQVGRQQKTEHQDSSL